MRTKEKYELSSYAWSVREELIDALNKAKADCVRLSRTLEQDAQTNPEAEDWSMLFSYVESQLLKLERMIVNKEKEEE